MANKRHVLSVLVDNRYGELARIVGLFSGRGFNIDSLGVNTTIDPTKSRVVITTNEDESTIEQITKQLNKLIRVHKVHHFNSDQHIERELMLLTVRCANAKSREDFERLLDMVKGRVLTFTQNTFTVEVTATAKELDSFIEMARPFGIKNMVRSAPVAMSVAGVEND